MATQSLLRLRSQRIFACTLAFFALTFTAGSSAQGQSTFSIGGPLPTQAGPHGVDLCDLNGDGWLDLVVTNALEQTIGVALGQGPFGFAPFQFTPVGAFPAGLALGDVDNDGDLDLITANSASDDLTILLGDGTGGFAPFSSLPIDEGPFQVRLGDLNGDGNLDVVVSCYLADSVSVLLGGGAGGLSALPSVGVGADPLGLILVDLDLDGDLDAVAANRDSDTVSRLQNDGSGVLQALPPIAVGDGPWHVASGDFNEDGLPDLLVTNNHETTATLLLGLAGGAFSPGFSINLGLSDPRGVVVGDIDQDGDADAVVTGHGGGAVALVGDGLGGFVVEPAIPTASGPTALALGDVDLDGDLDVVTPLHYANQVLVLQNQTNELLQFVRGDANGFPGVDLTDVLTVLNYLFNSDPVPCVDACDVDDSGVVNLLDVIVLLGGLYEGAGFPEAPFPSCGFDPSADSLNCSISFCP